MSAFLVDEIHINLIVTAAIDLGLVANLPPANDGVTITETNGEAFGRMLWAENARSVVYRYPLDDNSELNAAFTCCLPGAAGHPLLDAPQASRNSKRHPSFRQLQRHRLAERESPAGPQRREGPRIARLTV